MFLSQKRITTSSNQLDATDTMFSTRATFQQVIHWTPQLLLQIWISRSRLVLEVERRECHTKSEWHGGWDVSGKPKLENSD